ncbi:LysR family transcriptional regulator [Sphingobium sp. Ant17]|uniref:LysR family transcriptional regulator n=1 Tax=Sphingobium sp. Ant17 TaxID=1461752 RepID=UPI00044D7B46|nr:LysR family transcriptional regulator [Sphingobium sp. Ant17]EXS72043.1 LysR family transcriptional regulator [Sphingobium sp. Ant17]
MIDPRAIRTFLAVVRSNSISGGARLLNISQPSVSNAIAQLEQALGASLFERSRSGIVLTLEGEALLRRAESVDSLLRDAEAEVKLASVGVAGPLRVGGTPGALVSLLPDAVRRLEDRIGQFALHVVERPDHDLAAMLHRGEIELAFVTTGIEQPPEGIEERTFSRDPFALIVGRQNDHLPAKMSLKDMAAMRWVLPEARGAFRRQIDALFIAADISVPPDIIRCDSLLTTKAIVRGSQRVTILPMQVASAELSIGVLRAITIEEAEFSRSIGVRRLASGRLSRLASEMLETLIHSSSL